ncbi:acyl-CoA synthetase [Poriferisphaera sp. WC338]|uniref:SLOG cluster 4 domain-containing protein n=1 Tax=Poriferisphaera sp. WC338 TaxID=3425129 RepID=UPI003D81AB72
MTSLSPSSRRLHIAVIGDGDIASDHPAYQTAMSLGKQLMDHHYLIVTGGLAGIMEAAPRGAHQSKNYQAGSTLGILPGNDLHTSNQWIDIPIASSLGHLRNSIVAQSHAVIAIGGGAGTLSELCFAWIYNRLVIALSSVNSNPSAAPIGWSNKLLDQPLDHRQRFSEIPDDRIYGATSPEHVIELLAEHLPRYLPHMR